MNTGTTVSENCTYVQNPSFPTGDTAASAALTYTVGKSSNGEDISTYVCYLHIHNIVGHGLPFIDVCYLRLDFETFTLQGVGATTEINGGACTDTFVVTVWVIAPVV